jgi:hypothetical protein
MQFTRAIALVYFAPVAWDSYPQRPHYLVRHFLASGGSRVIWVDPYPIRLPKLQDVRRIGRSMRIPLERPAGLAVVRIPTLPIEPLAPGRWLNRGLVASALVRRLRRLVQHCDVVVGIGRPSLVALSALTALAPFASFYDAMDDYPEFYSGSAKAAVSACEREIVRNVDLVLTASSALWEKFEAVGRRRLMIYNAFEMSALPPLQVARNGHHVFGYVGCIGSWFDWTIVVRLAHAFRDAEVRVVGPCYEPPPHALPPNVHLSRACALSDAIDHCQRFSVGLIPFKQTRLTHSVDPLKYYKYRAMGLPVLTTRFGEMARRGIEDGAYVVDEAMAVEAVASKALAARVDAAAIDEFRRTHTWEHRFDDAGLFDRLGS